MIIGHRGQLGQDLARSFQADDLTLITQQDMDVRNEQQVLDVVSQAKPDVILNCSAYHKVDDCEDQAELALAVNAFGAMHLARAARATDCTLVHYSTDYVFGGETRTPHPENEAPAPRSIYAASKMAGEGLVLATWPKSYVIRSCGLYGYAGSREKGTNFVEMMIGLARSGKPLKIVDDQTCTPTATADLAAASKQVLDSGAYGLYHLTNDGECTWYRFALEIFRLMSLTPAVTPVASSEFPQKAKRPSYSVLDNARFRELGGGDMQPWQEALAQYVSGRAANGRQ